MSVFVIIRHHWCWSLEKNLFQPNKCPLKIASSCRTLPFSDKTSIISLHAQCVLKITTTITKIRTRNKLFFFTLVYVHVILCWLYFYCCCCCYCQPLKPHTFIQFLYSLVFSRLVQQHWPMWMCWCLVWLVNWMY